MIETQKAAVGGVAWGSASADAKKAPEAKPMPVVSKSAPKSKKLSHAATFWKSGEVFRDIDESWCPQMIWIPAVTFTMGSPKSEKGVEKTRGVST
ncbi:MAG: hypothetical protein ACRBM6_06665 [Geminicoccales bacterium]